MNTCPLHPDVLRPCHLCGIARVRAALRVAPKPAPVVTRDDKPDTTHDLALARKRADREAGR